MFSISFFLFVCVTATFADPFFQNINEGNPSIVPQQVQQQSDQLYSSSTPQSFMQGSQNSFPIPQQPMMQGSPNVYPIPHQAMMQGSPNEYPIPNQAMMQGFQSPFPFNPLNQQQLSLLMMSVNARMMALIQLMNMQNRYQPFSQYSDPAMNNFGQTPVPLPYAQQPQAETQNNLRNEMLQQQQQQAESQRQAILEERIKRKYDTEIQRREDLIKRQAEEEILEKRQKEFERQLRDEQEIEREKTEAKRQILEEEREELEKKENDRKLREEEELRFKRIEEEELRSKRIEERKLRSKQSEIEKSRSKKLEAEKLKQVQGIKPNMKPIITGIRNTSKLIVQPEK